MPHTNSIETYYQRIAEGIELTMRKRVIHFMSYHREPFARFELIHLLNIRESTLCGILNQLESDSILVEFGRIRSNYNKPNKQYIWNYENKKESPRRQLFLAI